MSIKLKLIISIVVSMVVLAGAITLVAQKKATTNMEASNIKKLEAITESKKGEITHYLDYIGGLLTSLAGQKGTHDAFLALDDAWYKIADEVNLNVADVTSSLKSNYASNYISKVDYAVPGAAQKRDINAYIPKGASAKVAQYMFIVDNNEKLGEKNGMSYNPKYAASSYMKIHKEHHSSFNKFL